MSHAIRLLELFQEGRSLGLLDLSTRLGLPRATVNRLLKTLLAHDLLIRDRKKYRLSLKLLDIAAGATDLRSRQEALYPRMTALSQSTGMTVHFAVLDGDRAGYLAVVDAPHLSQRSVRVGWRAPLSATAVGKVLLAWSSPALLEHVIEAGLPEFSAQSITSSGVFRGEVAEVQRSGYAVNDAEMFSGMYCVAVPVIASGNLMGALAVSGPSQMVPPGGLPPLVQHLKTEATMMAQTLISG